MTTTTGLELPLVAEGQVNKETTINTAITGISEALAATYIVDASVIVAPASSITLPYDNTNDLTARDALRFILLQVNNTASDPFDVIHPAVPHMFLIENNSGVTVTVKVAGQTGYDVIDGITALVHCNGTDVQQGGSYDPSAVALSGVFGFNATENLTIVSGSVTPTKSYITIDTEAAAATDDLDTIVTTNFNNGDLLFISSFVNTRDTTIKENTGNLNVPVGRLLNNKATRLVLVCNGTGWDELTYTKNIGTGWDYESAETTIALAGLTTFTHGLRVRPQKFMIYLVCQTAELDYVAGDEAEMGVNNRISWYVQNSTEIKVIVNGGSNPQVHHATTGVVTAITLASWKYVLKASL